MRSIQRGSELCLALAATALAWFYLDAIISHPILAPDSNGQIAIARNLIESGCLSFISCVPTHTDTGPIYPLFLSVVLMTSQEYFLELITISQYSICVLIIFKSIPISHLPSRGYRIALALSTPMLIPLFSGWHRFVLPDVLSMTLVFFMSCQFMILEKEGKINLTLLAVLMGFAPLLRFDLIVFTFPLGTLITLRIKDKAKRLGFFSMLVFPLILWAARGVALDIGAVRSTFILDSGSPAEPILVDFLLSFARSQYDLIAGLWPYLSGQGQVTLPPSHSLTSLGNVIPVSRLGEDWVLLEVKAWSDKNQLSFVDVLGLQSSRFFWIYLNPLFSAGWPTETPLGLRAAILSLDLESLSVYWDSLAIDSMILYKVVHFSFRLFVLGFIVFYWRKMNMSQVLGVVLVITFDVIFRLYFIQLETRYSNTVFSFLSAIAFFLIFSGGGDVSRASTSIANTDLLNR